MSEHAPQTLLERIRNGAEFKAAKVAVIMGIGITALTGCATESHAATFPGHTHSPSSTSSPEKITTPTPTPSETEVPLPASMEKYQTMSVADFTALPKQEQLAYAEYLQLDLPQFAAEYHEVSQNPNDVLNPNLSENSSAQDIMTSSGYENRFQTALTGDDREKFLIAVHYDGTDSAEYQELEKLSQEDPGTAPNEAAILAMNNGLEIPNAVSESGVGDTSDGTPFRVVTFTDPTNGSTVSEQFYYENVKTPVGDLSTWISK